MFFKYLNRPKHNEVNFILHRVQFYLIKNKALLLPFASCNAFGGEKFAQKGACKSRFRKVGKTFPIKPVPILVKITFPKRHCSFQGHSKLLSGFFGGSPQRSQYPVKPSSMGGMLPKINIFVLICSSFRQAGRKVYLHPFPERLG